LSTSFLLADVGDVAVLIPIVAIAVGGLIAITTMMTNHQRKMAELLRRDAQQQPGLAEEIRAMRSEMAELKDRVNQQTLMLESRPVKPPEVPERLRD
jgi:hypothetical protein